MKDKRKLPKYRYIVKVQFVNGNRVSYRLPIDVSHGLDQYSKNYPDGNYKEQILGSYINVPILPYWKNNYNDKMNPIIAVGHVIAIYKTCSYRWLNKKSRTTRSQFIIPRESNKKALYHNNIKYMQHDFDKVSKIKIRADINRMIYHKGFMIGSIIDAVVKNYYDNKMKDMDSKNKELWNFYFKRPY